MRRRDLRRLVAGSLAVAVVVGGCGSDDREAVDRTSFLERTQERYDADEGEAACITDYVYEDYDDGAVRTIHEEGVTGLPKNLWDPYFYAVIGCLTEDDPS